MRKISINGALLIAAALLVFSAEGVLVRLALSAAAGLFGCLFVEQAVRSREEEREETLFRMGEMYREQQAELADLLDQITEQILEGEEKRNESLGEFFRQNQELAQRLTDRISQALLELAGKGEEIGSLLEREERCCIRVEEQVKAMKTISEITAKKMQSLAEDHYNKMSDLFDDQNDNLSDSLESLKKDQLKLLKEHGEKLNENVKELNQVVASGIAPVLGQNQELLKYVQEVQKEWTSLDQKELDFLNRVWEDR